MTCKEAIDFLGDYLDGALPWRAWLVFRWHLWICRDCRRYLASYAATVRHVKALRSEPAEEARSVPEELMRAILAARRG